MRQAGNTSRGITRHIHNTSILGLSSVAVVIMNLDHGDERRRGACCAGVTTTEKERSLTSVSEIPTLTPVSEGGRLPSGICPHFTREVFDEEDHAVALRGYVPCRF